MAAVKIGRTAIAGMFYMLGYKTAPRWEKARFENGLAKLESTGTMDLVPEGAAPEDVATFRQVLTALGKGDTIELYDDRKQGEGDNPAEAPQDAPVAAPAGETAADPEPAADAPATKPRTRRGKAAEAPAAEVAAEAPQVADQSTAPATAYDELTEGPKPAAKKAARKTAAPKAAKKAATKTAKTAPAKKAPAKKSKAAKPKPAKTTPGGLKVHHPKGVDPSRLVLGTAKGEGPAHIREARTRGRLAGVAVAKFGLDHGVTDEMVAWVDDQMGRANPYQTIWACKMAWHAIQGYLKGDYQKPGADGDKAKPATKSKATAAPRKTAKKAAPKKATKKAPAKAAKPKAAAKKPAKKKTAKA
jgi:hypothetical protein